MVRKEGWLHLGWGGSWLQEKIIDYTGWEGGIRRKNKRYNAWTAGISLADDGWEQYKVHIFENNSVELYANSSAGSQALVFAPSVPDCNMYKNRAEFKECYKLGAIGQKILKNTPFFFEYPLYPDKWLLRSDQETVEFRKFEDAVNHAISESVRAKTYKL